MDMISFREEVLRLIAFRQEGKYWDFKKGWHKNKSDEPDRIKFELMEAKCTCKT